MAHLVLDEQLSGRALIASVSGRGFGVATVGDLGAQGRPDPDVMRRAEESQPGQWVLITMDTTIIEDHPRFGWADYAIAWISIHEDLRGEAVEQSKMNVVHRHLHLIAGQARGDHFTYSEHRHDKAPPSVSTQMRRKL